MVDISKTVHLTQSEKYAEFRMILGDGVLKFFDIYIFVKTFPILKFKFGYIPKINPVKQNFPIQKLKDLCSQNKLAFLRFDVPNVDVNTSAGVFWQGVFEKCGLKKAKNSLSKKTQFIDLAYTKEELLSKMHPKRRYNINLALKKGVEVREITDIPTLDDFYDLLLKTSKRQKFFIYGKSYYKNLCKVFNGSSHFLVAAHDNKKVAIWLLISFDGVLYYVAGASDYSFRSLFPSDLLGYEAILLGKELFCEYLDLWGAEEDKGFAVFKQRFGGETLEYIGTYDFVVNRVAYRIFTLLYGLFWVFEGLSRYFKRKFEYIVSFLKFSVFEKIKVKVKQAAKASLIAYLTMLAKVQLLKFGSRVIVITGSVGKTSLKDSLVDIFKRKYKILYSKKSYNSDIGLPLTVFSIEDKRDLRSYIKFVYSPLLKLLLEFKRYDYLIFEKDVQEPGDMAYLNFLTKCDYAVLLNVFPTHTENFNGSNQMESLFLEFYKVFRALKKDGVGLINYDNEVIRNYLGSSVGTEKNIRKVSSKMEGCDISYSVEKDTYSPKIYFKDSKFEIQRQVPYEYLDTFAYSIILSKLCGVDDKTISDSLREWELPPGRFSVLKGINSSTIIDSSYNSSLEACTSVLKYVSDLKGYKRKIFCLGDMRELGTLSQSEHKKLVPYINGRCDFLVLVGPLMRRFVAKEITLPKDRIFICDTSLEAASILKNIIEENDLIVFKGSQNTIYLEEAIKILLADANDKSKLCRQENYWMRIKKKYFDSLGVMTSLSWLL